jgi:hypothetical protein
LVSTCLRREEAEMRRLAFEMDRSLRPAGSLAGVPMSYAMSLDDLPWLRKCSANEAVDAHRGSGMTFDLRTWALHDAVFQLARESGLDAFRVECKQGPEGETVIALVLRGHGPNPGQRARDSAKLAVPAASGRIANTSPRPKKGE